MSARSRLEDVSRDARQVGTGPAGGVGQAPDGRDHVEAVEAGACWRRSSSSISASRRPPSSSAAARWTRSRKRSSTRSSRPAAAKLAAETVSDVWQSKTAWASTAPSGARRRTARPAGPPTPTLGVDVEPSASSHPLPKTQSSEEAPHAAGRAPLRLPRLFSRDQALRHVRKFLQGLFEGGSVLAGRESERPQRRQARKLRGGRVAVFEAEVRPGHCAVVRLTVHRHGQCSACKVCALRAHVQWTTPLLECTSPVGVQQLNPLQRLDERQGKVGPCSVSHADVIAKRRLCVDGCDMAAQRKLVDDEVPLRESLVKPGCVALLPLCETGCRGAATLSSYQAQSCLHASEAIAAAGVARCPSVRAGCGSEPTIWSSQHYGLVGRSRQ